MRLGLAVVVSALFVSLAVPAALADGTPWHKELIARNVTLRPPGVPAQRRRVSVDESLWGTHDPAGPKALAILVWWPYPSSSPVPWFVGHSMNIDVDSPPAFAVSALTVQPHGATMLVTVRWHALGQSHVKSIAYRVSYNQNVNVKLVSSTP
jgi:hypothetical protein